MPLPTLNLEGWWPGIVRNSPTAAGQREYLDLSGNDRHLLLDAAPTFVSDPAGGLALAFSNLGVAVAPDDPVFEMTGDATVALWVRFFQTGNDYLVTRFTSAGNLGWALYTNNGTLWVYNVSNLIGAAQPGVDGQYHHVAFTKIGTDLVLYIDGVPVASGTYGAWTVGTQPMAFGGSLNDGGWYMNAYQDDLAFWSRGLSPTEIADIYSEGILPVGDLSPGAGGATLRGVQFDHEPLGCLRQVEQYSSGVAPLGVETELPFTLEHRPVKREAVQVYAGEAPAGAAQIQRLGVDWDVDIETRKVRWLATARKPLGTTSVIIVRYWRRRVFDLNLVAQGLP